MALFIVYQILVLKISIFCHILRIYPHYLDENGNTKPIEEEVLKNRFPLTYEYLLNFKNILISKKIRYKTNPLYWYSLHRSREINIFETEKIITPQLQNNANFAYDSKNNYTNAGVYIFEKHKDTKEDIKFYLSILNSSLLWFFIKNTSSEYSGGYYCFTTNYLEPFPLPQLNDISYQNIFVEKTDFLLKLNKELDLEISNFLKTLKEEKKLNKISKKIETFYNFDFETVKNELIKQKVLFSFGKENDEWRKIF